MDYEEKKQLQKKEEQLRFEIQHILYNDMSCKDARRYTRYAYRICTLTEHTQPPRPHASEKSISIHRNKLMGSHLLLIVNTWESVLQEYKANPENGILKILMNHVSQIRAAFGDIY